MADSVITTNKKERLVAYTPGDSLVVVLYDRAKAVGGMLHVLLPDSRMDKFSDNSIAFNPYKYVDTAFPHFLKRFIKAGGARRQAELGIFGGSVLFDGPDCGQIGRRNLTAMRKAAWQQEMLVHEEYTGRSRVQSVVLDMQEELVQLVLADGRLLTYTEE